MWYLYTVHLDQAEYLTTGMVCNMAVQNVAYTNNNGSDNAHVSINSTVIKSFEPKPTSNYGYNYNLMNNTGPQDAPV